MNAQDHIQEFDFIIMWGDIRDSPTQVYNIILTNPSKAEFNDAQGKGKGYFTYSVQAYEDIDELYFKKGETFKLQLPLDSFAKFLHRKIMYLGWTKNKVLLSFKKINAKHNEWEITKI